MMRDFRLKYNSSYENGGTIATAAVNINSTIRDSYVDGKLLLKSKQNVYFPFNFKINYVFYIFLVTFSLELTYHIHIIKNTYSIFQE